MLMVFGAKKSKSGKAIFAGANPRVKVKLSKIQT